MKTLIIHADLLNPPTVLLCFRDFTFFCHYDYRDRFDDIVIEVARDQLNNYYKYLKKLPGVMDFVADFVEDDYKIAGVRLDNEPRYSPTILTPYINEKNIHSILRAVSYN